MKLKYSLKNNKKVYTLKDSIDNKPSKDAHYKFLKVRNAPNSKNKFKNPKSPVPSKS